MNSADPAPSSYDDPIGANPNAIDWPDLYHAVRKRWWLVALCLALVLGAATYYLSNQRTTFQARSVLFIEQQQIQVLDPTKSGVGTNMAPIQSLDMINTIVDQLRGYPFAERVAARLKLSKDPRFLTGDKLRELTGGGEMTPAEAANRLQRIVVASYRQKTRLIDIYATHPDASLAADIANQYADEYLSYLMDENLRTGDASTRFLAVEEEKVNNDLVTAEKKLQEYREQVLHAGSLEELLAATQSKLAELSKNISDTDTRLSLLDHDLDAANATPNDSQALLRLPSVAAEPRVAAINQQLAEQDRQFTLLKQRYRLKHPLYIATATQIDSLTKARTQLLRDVVGLLRGERQRLQKLATDLKREQDAQRDGQLKLNGLQVEYNNLKRAVETKKASHDALLERQQQIRVSSQQTALPVRVQEHTNGTAPLRTSPGKVYGLTALLGLLIGLGLSLTAHFMDHSVKTVDQAERIAGVPVLAAIPRKPKMDARTLDVVAKRDGIVAESFRSLRTSLAMVANSESRRVFMFTSAAPAEGKTFCSCNFSATLAQQGFRTLLIDADLRRPMVSRVLLGQHHRPGLADVLSNQARMVDAIVQTKVEDLSIMTGGSLAPNPAELLATTKLHELIQEALLTYDRVVIDTAPVLAVSDALLVAPHADVTCLVLRSFKTNKKVLRRALKALSDIDCAPAGVVFNFLPTGSGSFYYYSGKQHGTYGEKGVYGT